jgi:hypothetical protein
MASKKKQTIMENTVVKKLKKGRHQHQQRHFERDTDARFQSGVPVTRCWVCAGTFEKKRGGGEREEGGNQMIIV